MPRSRSRALTFVVALVAVVVVLGAVALVLVVVLPGGGVVASCTVGAYQMDPEQAHNAATIAAVAEQRDLPERAVIVALATALQESRLRNVGHGDRDSLGLFQQRPSQGWGTAAQVQDPVHAAGAFYDALVRVKGWQTLPVTVAAQKVQRSALPNAYAGWEPRATALTGALTGTTPAALSCHYDKSDLAAPSTGPSTTLEADAQRQLGTPVFGAAQPVGRGWLLASWLMSGAADYQIASVTYAGQTWDARTGRWSPADSTSNEVTVVRNPG